MSAIVSTKIRQSSKSKLSDFEIKERIGRGSFGSVYKAVRKSTHRTYVLKQPAPITSWDIPEPETSWGIPEPETSWEIPEPKMT